MVAPADVVLECHDATGTDVTGVANATDAGGTTTVSFKDAVVKGCGASKVITRTWTGTDLCGHIATAVQKISVTDTTAPTIQLPRILPWNARASPSTNRTGVATAQDACGSVTLSY